MIDTETQSTLVEADVTCLGCGYNLRGLARDGRCPECGESVERSLHGDLIRYADPKWVDRITRGLKAMYYSVVASLILGLFAAIIGGAFLVSAAFSPIVAVIMIAVWTAWVGIELAYPIGWWLATTRDPAESERRSNERVALRTTAVLFFPMVYAWLAVELPAWVSTQYADLAIELWTTFCFLFAWAHIVLMARSFRRLYSHCLPESEKRDRKAKKLLRKTEQYALWIPIGLLVIHWTLAGLDAAKVYTFTLWPGWTGFGSGMGMFLIMLLWLSVVSAGGVVLRAVKLERLVSIGLRRAGDARPPDDKRTSEPRP